MNPEKLYLRDVLGITGIIQNPEATPVQGVLHQTTQGQGLPSSRVTETPDPQNQSEWSVFGNEAGSKLVLASIKNREGAKELVGKMCSAISVTDYFGLLSAPQCKTLPPMGHFKGTHGLVFGKEAYNCLNLERSYDQALGSFVSWKKIHLFVTESLDSMLDGPEIREQKMKVWNHLKKIKGVFHGN